MKTPPDSRIGKGYSYLLAIAITVILASQSLSLKFQTNSKYEFQVSIESRDLNVQLFTAGVGIIGAILGLPTDAIALVVGKWLAGGKD